MKTAKIIAGICFLLCSRSFSQNATRVSELSVGITHLSTVNTHYSNQPYFSPGFNVSYSNFKLNCDPNHKSAFRVVYILGMSKTEYLVKDPFYFVKTPGYNTMHMLSYRMYVGVGCSYRRLITKKIIFKNDLGLCKEVVEDRARESKVAFTTIVQTPTGPVQNTVRWLDYRDRGSSMQIFSIPKIEFYPFSRLGFFVACPVSVTLYDKKNKYLDGSEGFYKNRFTSQILPEIGIVLKEFYGI